MRQIVGLRVTGAVAVAACVWAAGCAAAVVAGAAAAGVAGTYVYTRGRLESVEQAPLDRLYDATVRTMHDMEFTVTEQAKDALGARVVARRADRTDIRIDLERRTDDTTELGIRVGLLGNEQVSAEILSRIRENLSP